MKRELLGRISRLEEQLSSIANRKIEYNLPTLHPTQQKIVDGAKRFNVVCLGRRSGKTTLGVYLALVKAIEGEPVAWLSPTYRMLSEVWRTMNHCVPFARRRSLQYHTIEFFGGGIIEMWSMTNPNSMRGRKYARVIIDEAAYIGGLGDIYTQIIRPTLADKIGDLFLLSTPKGHNFFWQCYLASQHDPQWAGWQMPTTCNPYIHPDEIEVMRKNLPSMIARQEIDAEPIPDGGSVFRNTHKAATAVWQDMAMEGHSYIAGLDIGRTEDYTVITVLDLTTMEMVYYKRFSGMGFESQLAYVQEVHKLFNPTVLIVETNNVGQMFFERLYSVGLPVYKFFTSNQTKNHIIETLAIGIETGALRILDDQQLISELNNYQLVTKNNGVVVYGAASGHDDMVMSLALAYFAATRKVEVVTIA